MSILTSPLPDCIIWKNNTYKLNTDFRTWLEFERIMLDDGIASGEKNRLIRSLCFSEPPPDGAVPEALLDFYSCGHTDKKKLKEKSGKRLLSFEQDAEYIFSAFYAQYGIDLTKTDLHWYKFRALFAGLSDDNMIVKIMYYRSVDTSSIKDKSKKAFYRKMKRLYRIKGETVSAGKGLEGLFEERGVTDG